MDYIGLFKTVKGVLARKTDKKNGGGLACVDSVNIDLISSVIANYKDEFDISPFCKLSSEEINLLGKNYYWHYPLTIGGVFFDSDFPQFGGKCGRHSLRYKHFFPSIVAAAGGSLSGNTFLDCGCNCGFWSIQAILNGAESVVAFDAGEKNIEQAQFILDVTGIKGIDFRVADLDSFTDDVIGTYDISLFLGLLYHLNRPVDILRSLRSVTKKFAVVDTTISPDEGSVLYIEKDFAHDQNKCNQLCFLPTARAVYDLLIYSGFSDVKYIPNVGDQLPDDYKNGKRMTFIAYV